MMRIVNWLLGFIHHDGPAPFLDIAPGYYTAERVRDRMTAQVPMRIPLFSGHAFKWGFWFRICGAGVSLHWNAPVLFSERYGHSRYIIRVFGMKFEYLPRGQTVDRMIRVEP